MSLYGRSTAIINNVKKTLDRRSSKYIVVVIEHARIRPVTRLLRVTAKEPPGPRGVLLLLSSGSEVD